MNASRHTASAEQTWRTRANKHGNSLCRCETGAGTRPRQGRQTAGETDGADPEGPSSLPRTPEAVRGSYGVRAKEYGPNPAGARAELTVQTRRVQAARHARRRQCVARTEYGPNPQDGADPEGASSRPRAPEAVRGSSYGVRAPREARHRQCRWERSAKARPGKAGRRTHPTHP